MKKVAFMAGLLSLVLFSCNSVKLATTNDDVYVSPAEEKAERERIAQERKKAEEDAARIAAANAAAQKAKDDANPYYKDPQYSKDDYYDYQYASRLNRFSNNASATGMGYYDNYYTNYYSYNQNPAMYGTSIYSSYNYWGSGNGYSPYGSGVSIGFGYPSYGYGGSYGYGSPYGYGAYNPYSSYNMGYMNGYNSAFYGYPYGYGNMGYGYGYNPYGYNPYGYSPYGYSPYGSGWGYYNSYDVNSGYSQAAATYAPRGSHDGGNGGRMSMPGKDPDNYVGKFMHNEAVAQESAPRFVDVKKITATGQPAAGYGSQSVGTGRPVHYNNSNNGFNTYEPGRPSSPRSEGYAPGGNGTVGNAGGATDNNGNSGMSGPRTVAPGRNFSVVEEQPSPVRHHQAESNGNVWSQPQPPQPQYNPPPRSYSPPSNPQPSYQAPAPRSGGNFGGRPR